jgi:trk system potassium uptake protein TrkA
MRELELGRFDLRCLGVMRGEEFLECGSEGFNLQKDDILLILGGRSDLRDFTKSL